MRRPLLLAALLTLPSALTAQTHPLVGTWDVNMPAGRTTAKATLTFTIAGDSLIGMLKAVPVAGQPDRPVTRIAAKLAPGAVTFVAKTKSKLKMEGGEVMTRNSTSTYVFNVASDALKGTVEFAIEGMEAASTGGRHQITGTRAKS